MRRLLAMTGIRQIFTKNGLPGMPAGRILVVIHRFLYAIAKEFNSKSSHFLINELRCGHSVFTGSKTTKVSSIQSVVTQM